MSVPKWIIGTPASETLASKRRTCGITYSRFDTVGGDEIYIAGANGQSPINVSRHAWSDRDPTYVPAQR